MTPESLRSVSIIYEGEKSCVLDGAADAAVADFHPFCDFLAALIYCQGLLDVRCCRHYVRMCLKLVVDSLTVSEFCR